MKHLKFSFVLVLLLLCAIPAYVPAQPAADDLQAAVLAALNRYYENPFQVTADDNGKVIVRGKVDTYYDKLDVYEIVSKVPGVKEIEDLVVNTTEALPDDMVKANVVNGLKNSSVIIEPDSLDVSVDDGMVFLSGTVSFPKEKLMAETIASSQDGVMGLDNEIQVLPPAQARSDENLRTVIAEMIKYQFPLLDGKVKFTVVNGDVSLDGTVSSLWEKANVKKECSRILGVRSVTETLKIKT